MKVYTEPELYELFDNELNGWQYTDEWIIEATYEFDDFLESVSFVTDLAEVAEEMGHHPDIDIRYNTVRIGLVTHDEDDQITELDIALARAIEELVL